MSAFDDHSSWAFSNVYKIHKPPESCAIEIHFIFSSVTQNISKQITDEIHIVSHICQINFSAVLQTHHNMMIWKTLKVKVIFKNKYSSFL